MWPVPRLLSTLSLLPTQRLPVSPPCRPQQWLITHTSHPSRPVPSSSQPTLSLWTWPSIRIHYHLLGLHSTAAPYIQTSNVTGPRPPKSTRGSCLSLQPPNFQTPPLPWLDLAEDISPPLSSVTQPNPRPGGGAASRLRHQPLTCHRSLPGFDSSLVSHCVPLPSRPSPHPLSWKPHLAVQRDPLIPHLQVPMRAQVLACLPFH